MRPFGRLVPERSPPRWLEDFGSCSEDADAVLLFPARARSLLTVRAAISAAFFSERP